MFNRKNAMRARPALIELDRDVVALVGGGDRASDALVCVSRCAEGNKSREQTLSCLKSCNK